MKREKENLAEAGEFIAEYATHLLGCGVHTSRVVRSAKRIGQSFGYTVNIGIAQKHIVLTLTDADTHAHYNEVKDIPALPISFEHNARLSSLSWETFDRHLSLSHVRERYRRIVAAPPMHPLFVLIMTGLANASFCRLFGGDALSMAVVFSATLCGMFLKQKMVAAHINHYVVFILCAFVASLCASVAFTFHCTAETALATSVLYLVPGVPLINGVIDIVEGYVLTGFSRLIEASLLIICIAVGMSFTLLLVKDTLL